MFEKVVLTVLTLNVLQTGHHGKARYEAIERALQQDKPDIVTLQEVRRFSAERTSSDSLLTEYYRVVDGRYRGYQQAILTRYPIVRTLRVNYTNNRRRMALGAVVRVRDTEVLVLTTHLNYQLKHHRERQQQLRELFGAATDFDGPVIVTGDFNFGDRDGKIERRAIPETFSDAWTLARPGELGYTWDNQKNPMADRGKLRGEPSRRLDRILFRGLSVAGASLAMDKPIKRGLFPSDHFAVRAALELQARRAVGTQR